MSPTAETDQSYTEVTTEIDDAELSVSQEARTKRAIQLPNRLTYETLGESSEEVIYRTRWTNDTPTLLTTKSGRGRPALTPRFAIPTSMPNKQDNLNNVLERLWSIFGDQRVLGGYIARCWATVVGEGDIVFYSSHPLLR